MSSIILWGPFLKSNKLNVVRILLLGLIVSYVSLLLPLSLGKFFEITFGTEGNKTKALQLLGLKVPDDIYNYLKFFLLVTLIKFVAAWANGYFSSLLGESFTASLRERFFQYQLMQCRQEVFQAKASILLPFGSDIKVMKQFIVKGILGFIKDILFLLLSIYLLYSVQPFLTVVIIIMTCLFFGLHKWFNMMYKPLYTTKRKRQASYLNSISKILEKKNLPTEEEILQLKKKAAQLQRTFCRYHVRKSLLAAITPFMLYLMLAVVMVIIAFWIQPTHISHTETFIYILLLMASFPTIRNIVRIEHTWVQGQLSARRFIKAFDNQADSKNFQKKTNCSFSMLQSDITGN